MFNRPVADHMAPVIVNAFEMIDIYDRYRHWQLMLHCQRHFMLQHYRQIAAVK